MQCVHHSYRMWICVCVCAIREWFSQVPSRIHIMFSKNVHRIMLNVWSMCVTYWSEENYYRFMCVCVLVSMCFCALKRGFVAFGLTCAMRCVEPEFRYLVGKPPIHCLPKKHPTIFENANVSSGFTLLHQLQNVHLCSCDGLWTMQNGFKPEIHYDSVRSNYIIH